MLRTRGKDTTTVSQQSLRIVEENISRFWAALGSELHFSIEKTQLFTNIPHPAFNGILRSNIPATIAKGRVDEIVSQFERRHLPFDWIVSDHSRPGNLREILKEKGLQYAETWTGLHHNLRFTPDYQTQESNISIQPITNYDNMMIWAANFAESMDIPFKEAKRYADLFTQHGVKPFRHFIASIDGVCVGVATIYFLNGVVGIYNLTIKQSARKQGVGAAIVSYLLHHAKKIDSKAVVLYIPQERHYTYLHMGFQQVMSFDIFRGCMPNMIQN